MVVKSRTEDLKAKTEQLQQLQQYIHNVEVIKEQYNSSKVADNHVQIMQDLQKVNLDLQI